VTAPILLDAGQSTRGWHRNQTMLRCAQLFAYKYLLGLNVTGEPRIKGSLAHIGAAHHYARMQARQQGWDPDRYHDPMTAIELLAASEGPDWTKHVPKIQAAIRAYVDKYGLDEVFEVLAVEQQYHHRIAAPPGTTRVAKDPVTGDLRRDLPEVPVESFLFSLRADLTVRDRSTGRVRWIDHKSTGRVHGSSQVRKFTLSGQFLGMQVVGAEFYGDKWGGCQVNFIGLEPPHSFLRRAPPAAPNALAHFEQAIVDSEMEQIRLEREGRDPWSYPKKLNEQVCGGRYGPCDGWDLCQWGRIKGGAL